MRTVRLFVSSPGDVGPERQRVSWIAERLNGEFEQFVRFEKILWENSVYNAHEGGFQPQIKKPADCDIVLTIFWSRLGTELPDDFAERMPDGRPYPSGTAYEVLSALEARKANQHRPDVFVFRKLAIPTVPVPDKAAQEEAVRQWERLQDFFARFFELPDKRILRVVEKFRDIGELDRKVELLLRDWIESNVWKGTIWRIEEKGSPFRGLEPFEAKHTDVYFGRDRKILRAIDELKIAAQRGKPFLLIPGASGSGKSSLMRAGLAPRLVRPGTIKDVDLWRIAVMRPGTDENPILALARALFVTGDEKKDDPGGFGKALPELGQGAFRTPEDLALLFKDTATAKIAVKPIVAALDDVGKTETLRHRFERPLQANLLLLVDQFEEIFAGSITPQERLQFANLLAALLDTQRIWLIATLRGDMYESMITERPFVGLKDICGQFDLDPPGPDELDEIVHRSAEAADLHYEERVVKDDAGNECWERLDDRLLQGASGENTLPLLQFALDLLFEKCWVGQRSKELTFAAYEEIGGLDGAINQTAELALARLVREGADIRFPLEKGIQEEIARTINPRLEALLRKLVVPVGRDSQKADASAERALTARIVPIGEARGDEPTGQLIDALVQARILLASQSKQGSYLRIAHDRVITSWYRGRAIIEKNRDFYRVKESIEQERQRWEESNCSVEFLIPAGARITQAEEAVQRFGDYFSQDTRDFVAVSSRRARFRQRLMKVATIVFAFVAVIATGASYYAIKQTQRATENYEAARDTVGRLVTSIAQKLRDLDGIEVKTVEEALNQVEPLVKGLETQNKADPELQRIRASMHYEFAKVFQNTGDLSRALKEAETGLQIRNQLAALSSGKREWLWDHAESLDQVGDIHRALAKEYGVRDPRAPAEFATAGDLFDQAYQIRLRLHSEEKDNPKWTFGLSQNLVRLGALKDDWKNDVPGANADFENSIKLMIEVFRREPDNVTWLRELSWDFNFLGSILIKKDKLHKEDLAAALGMYEKALCIRRYIASQDQLNTLYKRDVAFSLMYISRGKFNAKDYNRAEEALIEELKLRENLTAQDHYNYKWMRELGANQHRIGTYMWNTQRFALAAGFFAKAFETREKQSRLVRGKRDAAISDKERKQSSEELDKAVRKLSPQLRSAQDLDSLKDELKKQADKWEDKMSHQLEARVVQPETDWKKLKESLMKTALAQQP